MDNEIYNDLNMVDLSNGYVSAWMPMRSTCPTRVDFLAVHTLQIDGLEKPLLILQIDRFFRCWRVVSRTCLCPYSLLGRLFTF